MTDLPRKPFHAFWVDEPGGTFARDRIALYGPEVGGDSRIIISDETMTSRRDTAEISEPHEDIRLTLDNARQVHAALGRLLAELSPPKPLKRRWERIPGHLRDGITNYVQRGWIPGGFLQAVISNDLRGAFGQADEISRDALADIVAWFYAEAPSPCWGSAQTMHAWAREHANGLRRAHDNEHHTSKADEAGDIGVMADDAIAAADARVILDVTDHEQTDALCKDGEA